jgi:WD40 repeat protein
MVDADCVLATGGYDHTVRLWRPSSGAVYHTFAHESVLTVLLRGSVLLSPQLLTRWLCANQKKNQKKYIKFGRLQQVNSLAITPNRRFVAVAGSCMCQQRYLVDE